MIGPIYHLRHGPQERSAPVQGDTPPGGVYRVFHRASGRSLIGASPDAPAILRRVQFQLEMGSHPNKPLQQDWDADGENGFEFRVLDVLPPATDPSRDIDDDLKTLLGLWTEKLHIEPGTSY